MLSRALAALLLAAGFAAKTGAQTVRVTGGLSLSASPIPVVIGPGSPAIFSPVLSPFSMAPSLLPVLAAPVISVTPALTVTAPAAATVDAMNPEREDAAAAAPFTPADGWASRFNFSPGNEFFDGERSLLSEAGAVFAAVPKPNNTVRVHIVELAPLAALRPIGGTEDLSGRALLDKVTSLAAQGQRQRAYEDASDYLFSKADNVVINGVRGVIDAYSGIFVPGTSNDGSDYPERGDQNGDGYGDSAGMNVEHAWPQSLFNRALPMRSDLHHLMATFRHPNSIRDNLPFGVVTGSPEYENAAGARRGGGIFEPPDAVKGHVARGLLYFYARYKDSRFFGRASAAFWNRQIDTLLRWNSEHPPDAFEAERNNLVESYQGNRNPFVDDPGLADRIGVEILRATPPVRGPKGARGPRRTHASKHARRRS